MPKASTLTGGMEETTCSETNKSLGKNEKPKAFALNPV